MKPLKPTTITPKTANPHYIIIQVHHPISVEDRPNGIETRRKINDMLDRKDVPNFFRVMAIGYSGAGNIKITTIPTCKASNLLDHGHDMAALITKNEVLSVLPDMEHY